MGIRLNEKHLSKGKDGRTLKREARGAVITLGALFFNVHATRAYQSMESWNVLLLTGSFSAIVLLLGNEVLTWPVA